MTTRNPKNSRLAALTCEATRAHSAVLPLFLWLAFTLPARLPADVQVICGTHQHPNTATGGCNDEDRIQPYAKNPFYWQHNGKPVLLLGGSDDDNLFQWTGTKLTEQLDLLKSVGGNYLRNTMSDRDEGGEWGPAPEGVTMVCAFGKIGDRYDLNQWNEEYWRRLDNFLRETHRREIFVQIELWDAFDFTDLGKPKSINTPLPPTWSKHPWNPKNNVNYTAEETGVPDVWTFYPSSRDHPLLLTVPKLNNVPKVLRFQERYARKVLEVSLKYDHVLYAIQNEVALPQAWSDYWAAFLHRESRNMGHKIQVTDMKDNWDLRHATHQYVVDHPKLYTFMDVSQNTHNSGQTQWDRLQSLRAKLLDAPRPMNSTKMYVQSAGEWKRRNTPELAAVAIRGEAPARLWRNIIGGTASARFHRPPIIYGLGLGSIAQTHIRSLRTLTDAMNVFACEPHNDLLSERNDNEAYAMVGPGRQYAVYFPNGGLVKINLSAARGQLRSTWLDISNSRWMRETVVRGGAAATLQAPGQGHWAVLIKATPEAIGDN